MKLLGIAGLLVASAASAQVPLRERTGPDAEPPALPAFPEPQSGLPAPTPPLAAYAVSAQGVVFTDVDVAVEGAGQASPRAGWTPTRDAVTGLALAPPGPRGFDADWVRRQFLANALVGRPVALDQVTALVQAINLAFVQNGFINSGVLIASTSAADGGLLHLRLVYGQAADLTVAWTKGSGGLSRGYVLNRFPSLARAPLNAIDLERDFRALADDPAVATVNASLQPGHEPGRAALTLTVAPAPRVDLYASFANSRSPSIGGERFAIGGSLRNLLTPGDLLAGETGRTAGRSDAQGSYQAPLFDPDLRLLLRGGYNDAAVVDPQLRPLDIHARDWNIEGGISRILSARPLLPREGGGWSPAETFAIGLLAAHRETRTYLLGQPFSFSPGSVDGRSAYTALRITADYTRRSIAQVLALSLTLTQGIAGTRSDVPDVPAPSRDFRAALAQASYARRLDGKGLELRLRLAGQWAGGLLYSGERLAAGGEYSVRGYRETLILADTGLIGSVELARPFRLGGDGGARRFDWGRFSASLFADGALVHNRRGPQPEPRHLESVGASLAWIPAEAISARITYGLALTDAPVPGARDLQDDGVQFRITVRPLLLFARR